MLPFLIITINVGNTDNFHGVSSSKANKLATKNALKFQLSSYYYYSRGSSPNIVTRLGAGRSGFDSLKGQKHCLFATVSRPALGPTHPRIQCVPELFPGE
jgi:hypothetical protein